MKALFGKISIGCFIVFYGFLVNANSLGIRGHEGIVVIAKVYLVLTVLGGIFAIVGAIRKEHPKAYYLTGFFLHFGLFLLLLLFFRIIGWI